MYVLLGMAVVCVGGGIWVGGWEKGGVYVRTSYLLLLSRICPRAWATTSDMQ